MTAEPLASAPIDTERFIAASVACCLVASACGGRLQAGWDEPAGPLPVDGRNPIVLCNDGASDNWQGEYAMLFANAGGPALAGIVITASWNWQDLNENLAGWEQMVAAARQSGLRGIPDPLASDAPILVEPSSGDIDDTTANGSAGARFIVDISRELALPHRPLVLVTGNPLTDVADAYLLDPTLPDRVVVVASLGSTTGDGADMGVPNGNLDFWASVIVARKFRYVQVSAFYGQGQDVPSSLLGELQKNAFTSWIEAKQPDVWDAVVAADQVGVVAVAVPEFVVTVTPAVQDDEDTDGLPLLSSDPAGPVQLVTEIDSDLATARFQEMLLAPATFGGE